MMSRDPVATQDFSLDLGSRTIYSVKGNTIPLLQLHPVMMINMASISGQTVPSSVEISHPRQFLSIEGELPRAMEHARRLCPQRVVVFWSMIHRRAKNMDSISF